MADTKLWKRRVEEWRASGLSSKEFCTGQDFTPGGLRHWAHRLRTMEGQRARPAPEVVRLARVVRAAAPRVSRAPAASPAGQGPPLMLEAQGVRIAVRPGFCAATLSSVLDVLERRAPRTRRAS